MRIVTTLAVWLIAASAAQAACFENLGKTGCTNAEVFPRSHLNALSCENLWWVRNTIYHENGYCFRSAKARAQFDNTGCTVSDGSKVRVNSFERMNITRISEIEKQKRCAP